jgi:hypothetical protein
MDSPKLLTPKDVEEAASQLKRQLQGVTGPSLERIRETLRPHAVIIYDEGTPR